MRILTCLSALLFTALLAAGGAAGQAQSLKLTFGPGQEGTHTAGTRNYVSRELTSLYTVDGEQVILQRESGEDYRIQAGQRSRSWFQVQQVPAQESYIAVTPSLEGDHVILEVVHRQRNGDRSNSIATTVRGSLGSWIPLTGTGINPVKKGGRRYSTATAEQRVAVKVEKTP